MKVILTKNQWNSVVTTTAETVVQNRSSRVIYVTGETTTSLDLDDGIELGLGDAVVFKSGVSVSAASIGADTVVFYTTLE